MSNSGDVGYCLTASAQHSSDAETETLLAVAHALRGEGFDAGEDGTGRGTPLVPVAMPTISFQGNASGANFHADFDVTGTLRSGHSNHPAVAFEPFTIMERGRDGQSNLESRQDGTANAILTPNGGRGSLGVGAIATPWAVRRLTPEECEALQGFPRGFTKIPYRGKPADKCPDGPRYKAIGNSWAVNAAEWISERIADVDAWDTATDRLEAAE